jgi:hypothetical protein
MTISFDIGSLRVFGAAVAILGGTWIKGGSGVLDADELNDSATSI